MAISFTGAPYFDDFDPSKNYHRILFKPGYAVQSRELTQLQTSLQRQISSFADNIFAGNTPVSGGKVTVNLKCYYLKLTSQYNGVDVVASDFKNRIITNATGTVLAKVIATAEATGSSGGAGDPPTLIISYFSGGQFGDATQIFPVDGSNYTALTSGTAGGTTCTGLSSVASISDGVFYVRHGYYTSKTQNDDGSYSKYTIGNFVAVQPQTIILNKYTSTPSYRIGLNITETVSDYIDDPSLLDPAIGASNYQAPGADRYTIILTLTTLPLELGNDDGFIELVRINSGSIVKQVDSTVYSTIDDYIAKRTFDTNGDFIVNDFALGTTADNTNSAKYNIKIGKGVAYVRGYRIENQSDIVLNNDRSRATESVNNNSVYTDYGSYFYVDTVKGVFDGTVGQAVDLHLVPVTNIVSTNTTTYNSTLVGKGYIRNLVYDRNLTDANTASYVYRSYVYSITANTLSSNVSSASATNIVFYDTTGQFSATTNAYFGVILTIDSGTGAGYTGTITSYTGSTKTATINPIFPITPDTTSKFSLRFTTKDVETVVSTTPGTYTLVANSNINVTTGKVGGVATGSTILNNPQSPELIYPIGNPYIATISDSSYSSTKTFRNKSFSGSGTVSLALTLPVGIQSLVDFAGGTGTLSTDAIKRNYTVIVTSTTDTANNGTVGSIMDFCTSGNTVTVSSDKNTVTFSSTKYKTPLSVTVISNINITNADDTTAIQRRKTLVTGNTSIVSYAGPSGVINSNTYVDLTNGQVYIKNAGLVGYGQTQSLYVTDVKKIKKIIDTGAPGTVPTTSMLTGASYDITKSFAFNNGQKDTFYDHAFLTLRPNAPKPKGNILVIFDFYSHSAADGYFSGQLYTSESYGEIPTYTATNGNSYNLRDCLDFRPSRKNATATYGLETSADPASSDAGTYIPQDLTNFISNYSFYYGRKDKLVLSKDKNFQIIQGNPATNPIFPTKPDGALEIANLTHDPYTVYLPSEAPQGTSPNLSIEKVRHRRWTMNDITTLQNQVNNIEYYTTLNLLEQNANRLQVADSRGLNRFKNGIVVDNFSSTVVSDTGSPDFNAAIDRVTQQMTSSQSVTSYPLQPVDSVSALGQISTSPSTLGYKVHTIGKSTNIFTLPYSTAGLVEQKLASTTVFANQFTTPVYQGVCSVNPPMDNWVDDTREPNAILVDNTTKVSQTSDSLNTINVNNWQSIPSTLVPTASQVAKTSGTTPTQLQQATQGAYTNLGTSYENINGYIKDASIQPYIRKQSLLIRAKSLKVNTPIKTFFDGISVDNYITNPDIIELTNVTGTFNEDDIVGYKDSSGNFYPIAIVASVQAYAGTSNVRLYVCSQTFSGFRDYTPTIYNAIFDQNGAYVSSTAYGTAGENHPITVNLSGKISAVGGTFTDANTQSLILYRVNSPAWTDFMNKYGVWSNSTSTNPFDVSFTVNFPTAGTYTFNGMFDNIGKIYVDGTQVVNGTAYKTQYTQTKILTAGNHTVRLTANNNKGGTQAKNPSCAAMTITDSAGNMIYNTSQYTETAAPLNSGTAASMVGGGLYYTGATQIVLSTVASANNDFYVGCKISVTSTYINAETLYNFGTRSTDNKLSSTYYNYNAYVGAVPTYLKSQVTNTYTATITAYDGSTKVATLSTPINVSIGDNTLVGGSITSSYSIAGTKDSYKLTLSEGGTAKLSTDEKGAFVGIFDVPEGIFKTGERVFRIDNRTADDTANSATTWAEATFYATGLSSKSLSRNFASSVYAASQTFKQTNAQQNSVTQTQITTESTVLNTLDPVAQAFNINGVDYPNGVFINSVKLFFQNKPTTTDIPITLSVVGTQNGYPNGQTLDHSIVTLHPNKVNVSSTPHYLDSTTWTEFTFEAPIYIQPNNLYAFVLQSASQDYSVYVASKNAIALPSTAKVKPTDVTPTTVTKIGSEPYVGALFESQNAITWTADQTKAMMFVVSRCVFDITKTPKIKFSVPKNLPNRKTAIKGIQGYYSADLSDNVQGVYTKQDVESHAFNISTTDLITTGTNISYSYIPTIKSTLTLGQEKTAIPGKFGCPTFDNIYLNDGYGPRVLQANNSNSFFLYATLSSSSTNISPVLSDDGLTLFNIKWNINNLELSNNNIVLVNGGSGYNANTTSVTISSPDVSGGTQAYAAANISGGVVQSVYLTSSGSGYLSTPTYSIIDANTTPGTGASATGISEYSSSGGNALSAYVTKKTTLATNDSGDLRVFFSAYRPAGTNIYVFYRIQNQNDDQAFENGSWQLMTYLNNTGNMFSSSRTNILEFEAAPGVGNVANNQVAYTSTNETTYTTFNQFAIKIVMTTNDKTAVPFLADMRALALPTGTGF